MELLAIKSVSVTKGDSKLKFTLSTELPSGVSILCSVPIVPDVGIEIQCQNSAQESELRWVAMFFIDADITDTIVTLANTGLDKGESLVITLEQATLISTSKSKQTLLNDNSNLHLKRLATILRHYMHITEKERLKLNSVSK